MKYTNAQSVGEAIFKELLPEVTRMLKMERQEKPVGVGVIGKHGMRSRWYAKKSKGKK